MGFHECVFPVSLWVFNVIVVRTSPCFVWIFQRGREREHLMISSSLIWFRVKLGERMKNQVLSKKKIFRHFPRHFPFPSSSSKQTHEAFCLSCCLCLMPCSYRLNLFTFAYILFCCFRFYGFTHPIIFYHDLVINQINITRPPDLLNIVFKSGELLHNLVSIE